MTCVHVVVVVVAQVEEALPADAKRQLLRAQYTSAIGLRLAFFLSQGILSSQVSGRSNIDGAAGEDGKATNPRGQKKREERLTRVLVTQVYNCLKLQHSHGVVVVASHGR